MPGAKECLGVPEISRNDFSKLMKAVFAEFLGTMLLNFFGCASTISWPGAEPSSIVQISLAFGLAAAVIIQTIGHISGGHINPAVTLAMMITSNITILRAVLYVVAQCLGAIVGSGILRALTPVDVGGNLGTTIPDSRLTAFQAFGMEFFLGLMLLLVVFAVCDPHRNLSHNAPIAIGFAIFVGHLAAVPFTGASMNPAGSLGAAVVSGEWSYHWVYWLGPILGGMVSGLIYRYLFSMKAPSEHIKAES